MWKRDVVLNELELDNLRSLRLARHAQTISAVSYGDPEIYKHYYDEGASELKQISKLLFPWLSWGDDKGSEYKRMWEDWFGIKSGSEEWNKLERTGELIQKYLKQEKNSTRPKT